MQLVEVETYVALLIRCFHERDCQKGNCLNPQKLRTVKKMKLPIKAGMRTPLFQKVPFESR